MTALRLRIARAGPARAPAVLVAAALLVAAAMLLPPAYLTLRVLSAGAAAWEAVARDSTAELLLRTCLLAAAVTGAAFALSVPLAWLTARTDLPLRRLWSVLLPLPLVFPSYVGAFAFVAALGPRGLLRDLLGVAELPEIYGFAGAWLVLTLFTYPYVLLPLRAAMQGLDRSLEETARALGQGSWATFRRVVLPQLRPAAVSGALLVALYTVSDFGAVSILRYETLTRVIYIQYTSSFDRSAAAALALLLVGITLAIVALEGATRGRARYYARSRGRPATARLGLWRWPAAAFCGLVTAVALVLPLGVMLFWLVRGLESGRTLEPVWDAAFNSVFASGAAAVAAVAAALPIALLSARHPGPLSGLLEKASYVGFGLPGISVALALVFFAANYAPLLYQSIWLLVFAYVVRFLPQALGSVRSSLLQVNPHTEEAARGLGRGRAAVFARITVPQVVPGLSAGGGLVFLTAMKELPATLLLSPIGFENLAVRIWSASSEALFAQAALPALVLVALSAVPMLASVARERGVP